MTISANRGVRYVRGHATKADDGRHRAVRRALKSLRIAQDRGDQRGIDTAHALLADLVPPRHVASGLLYTRIDATIAARSRLPEDV